jgi:hypothetical protein
MAVRELFSVIKSNISVATGSGILAGMAIARDTTTGLGVVANRAADTDPQAYVGIAADDASRTGVTGIYVDPVGATALVDGVFTADNNGLYAGTKRALGDYYDETVSNVTNLTAGSTGAQGPMRPLGYFSTPSAQFATDQFVIKGITVACADSAFDTDTADAADMTTNDKLTYGSGVNAGKLVR